MKIVVIGATGVLGSRITNELLAAGHEVTAFARRSSAFTGWDGRPVRVDGDALDPEAVRAVVKDQDAVVVALGSGMSRKSKIRSQGTLNVIRAMQVHGVQRLICQSTLGARDSWSTLNFFWKHIMFGGLLRPMFKDHELQEQMVEASGLDWTIVRPSAFDKSPRTGQYIEDVQNDRRGLRLKITLGDIAGFVARQIEDKRYLHRAVGIST